MRLTCPECKNEIDLTARPDLKVEDVVECEFCGITLMVTGLADDQVSVEIVEEGK